MATLKTQATRQSASAFVGAIPDAERRRDCKTLLRLMREVTGAKPTMWGDSIVGFGTYHYKYTSGREGDWFLTGFSPRKDALTIYLMTGFEPQPQLMRKLGKHKTGKACLYVKSLADIDLDVLAQLLHASVRHVRS